VLFPGLVLLFSSLLLQVPLLTFVVVFYMLALYVGVPAYWLGRLLRRRASIALKVAATFALGALGLWTAGRGLNAWQPGQEMARRSPPQPVRLTVQQPGLLPYPLGRGTIEHIGYGTGRCVVVSGDLPDGRRLQARLEARPSFPTPFATDSVTVTVEDGEPVPATGRSVYRPVAGTVTGEFQCVLPSGQRLVCSFSPTRVVVQ
jgi:hypothetical protein